MGGIEEATWKTFQYLRGNVISEECVLYLNKYYIDMIDTCKRITTALDVTNTLNRSENRKLIEMKNELLLSKVLW